MTNHFEERLKQANHFYHQNQLTKARDLCESLLKEKQDDILLLQIYAVSQHRLGNHDVALEYLEKALKLNPNAATTHYMLGLILLWLGDFKRGWQEYEWRLKEPSFNHPSIPLPRWEGEKLNEKHLLILSEQGHGDMIQMMRFLPLVCERVKKITLLCHQPLLRLMNRLRESMQLTTTIESIKEYDYVVFMSSLPRIFKINNHTIPKPFNNVFYDRDQSHYWSEQFNQNKKNIGIVWQGAPHYENDIRRSCPLEKFFLLKNIPNVQFYGLGIEPVTENIPVDFPFISLAKKIKDFADTAAIISALDYVISVDTAAVHLAGALNKPTYVLLPFIPDWRWAADTIVSPWYKSVKLIRQEKPDDWDAVFAHLEPNFFIGARKHDNTE